MFCKFIIKQFKRRQNLNLLFLILSVIFSVFSWTSMDDHIPSLWTVLSFFRTLALELTLNNGFIAAKFGMARNWLFIIMALHINLYRYTHTHTRKINRFKVHGHIYVTFPFNLKGYLDHKNIITFIGMTKKQPWSGSVHKRYVERFRKLIWNVSNL